MYKKFMELLASVARDIVDRKMQIEEAIVDVKDINIDIQELKEELAVLENMGLLDREEMDALKSILVSILIKSSSLEPDAVYSMIFEQGKKITWH